ncbi:hypothetical protein STEG23_038090 [Scotinomys teguina]
MGGAPAAGPGGHRRCRSPSLSRRLCCRASLLRQTGECWGKGESAVAAAPRRPSLPSYRTYARRESFSGFFPFHLRLSNLYSFSREVPSFGEILSVRLLCARRDPERL